MSVHLHRTRQWTAWVLSALALSPFALAFGSAGPASSHLSPVTGQVMYSGRPLHDMTLCLDTGGHHAAFGLLQADGTFSINNMTWGDEGTSPGRYRAHLYSNPNGPELPSKYRSPETSGIEVEVASGWNDFRIDLH